jgi:hypothetical protein
MTQIRSLFLLVLAFASTTVLILAHHALLNVAVTG